jgi:phage-related protein
MAADGSITLATKVDTKGIKNSERTVKNAAQSIGGAFGKASRQVQAALNSGNAEMQKLALSSKKATANFDEQARKVDELRQKLSGLQSGEIKVEDKGVSKLQSDFDKTTASIQKAEAEISTLYQQLEQLQNNAFRTPDTGETLLTGTEQAQFDKINTKLDQLEPKLEADKQKAAELGEALKNATGASTQASIDATNAKLQQEQIKLEELKIKAQQAGDKLNSGMKNAAPSVDAVSLGLGKLGNKLIGMAKRVFIFSMLTKLLRGVLSAIGNAIMADEGFRQSLGRLQGALWTAFAPIYAYIVPAIRTFINWIASAINAVVRLIAALTGKSYAAMVANGKALQKQADAYKNMGKSSKKSAKDMNKATKEAEKQIAAFDELNILTQHDADAGDGGGAGGAEGGIEPIFDDGANMGFSIFLDGIKEKLNEIVNIFKTNFWQEFNKADFSGLKSNLQIIGDEIVKIFSSERIRTAANNLVIALAANTGKITGTISGIFVTAASVVSGGIAKFFVENSAKIIEDGERLINRTTNIVNSTGQIISTLGSSMITGMENARPELEQGISDLCLGLEAFGVGISDVALGLIESSLSGISVSLKEHQPLLDAFFTNFFKNIGELASLVGNILTDIGTTLSAWWNDSMAPVWETFIKTLTEVGLTFLDLYNKWISPVISYIIKGMQELWDNHLSGVFRNVLEAITDITELATILLNNTKVALSWLIDTFQPYFVGVMQAAWNGVQRTIAFVADIIDGILTACRGLIQFLTGIFSGDWDKVWEGCKTAINGVLDIVYTFGDAMENAMNGAISVVERGVNWIIDKINSISFDIPDWVPGAGGKNFGFNLPKLNIPRLAQGAVLPPNKPFLAMVGDQKSGTNVEAPLETIVEALTIALQGQNQGSGQTVVQLMLDRRELGRAVIDTGSQELRRTKGAGYATKVVFG